MVDDSRYIDGFRTLLWWNEYGSKVYEQEISLDIPDIDPIEMELARKEFLKDLAEEIFDDNKLWN